MHHDGGCVLRFARIKFGGCRQSDFGVSTCPSSVTPHPIRRGYITHLLKRGVPVEVVSERCNVSPGIIDEHYDVRSAEEKMRQRCQILEEVQRNGSADT